MSDIFHKDVPEAYIRKVCEVMRAAYWHTFQILTKRSERMRDLLNGPLAEFARMDHIWWGVSVEDRRFGVPRIRHLQEIRAAAFRWLSVEPLLEDVGPPPVGLNRDPVACYSNGGFRVACELPRSAGFQH